MSERGRGLLFAQVVTARIDDACSSTRSKSYRDRLEQPVAQVRKGKRKNGELVHEGTLLRDNTDVVCEARVCSRFLKKVLTRIMC